MKNVYYIVLEEYRARSHIIRAQLGSKCDESPEESSLAEK